ncbi:MAG: phosphoribosylformylglycinamidine synthase subunit PurL [Candidatus Bathyarchaeota archaeon]|jgi:phosphoribosylformylglycinamidine synthase
MSLYIRSDLPFELHEIRLTKASSIQLLQISKELGLGLSLEEMKAVQNYFFRKKRNPTDVELQTIGQTWSEHCYHKTFKGDVVTEKGTIKSLFKTYIAKPTIELNLDWCISVFEDNAGIIDFDKGFAVAAKVETHNHPSAIEPFGGAATGVGGVIRDILGVWAEPIACTDVLGFGPLDYKHDKLPVGVKHPKYVFSGVVAGIGYYGNNMGIPTVNGAIYFDESYVGSVVVYCGCIGILPRNKLIGNAKPNDIILLAGGKTGRDGIHGVTFASAELTEKSEEISRPAVQIANPIEEERLKRAIIEVRDRQLGSAITDLGGGGLSSAIGETARKSRCGAHVGLEHVPLKHLGMAPWEIYISESQERMVLLIPEKNLQEVLEIFENENVQATPIGEFTKDEMLKITYHDHKVAEIEIEFLFKPPKARRMAKWRAPNLKEPSFSEPEDLSKTVLGVLSSPNVASKEAVVRTYDHEVKGNTALKPLQGRYAGPSDASVLKPLADSWKGIVISCGMNPNYGRIDPYWMAASSIDEAVRNNTAVGGRRIALLDNFTWGNPEKPDRMSALVRACQACYKFAKGFGAPFISGKDSLYNESPSGPVTPTLLITAVGVIPDVRRTVSMDVKQSGNMVYIVGQTYPELGGSEYYKLRGFLGKNVPEVRVSQASKIVNSIVKAIDLGYVKACHDLSEGGLAVAASEMAFTGDYGIDLHLKNVPRPKSMQRNDFTLFSESNSRFLVEVQEKQRRDFEASMKDVTFSIVGRVRREKRLLIHGIDKHTVVDVSLAELRDAWKSTFGG